MPLTHRCGRACIHAAPSTHYAPQAPFDDTSLQRVRDPFEGISQQPFPKEVAERLMQRIPPEDIEIRPDGLIYLPEIKYRCAFIRSHIRILASPVRSHLARTAAC